MRLLDRYLLRELCIPLIYCLAGFFIFWISFDLFDSIDEFQSAKLTFVEVIQYYLIKAPDLLSTTTPIALLLALLYTLSNHGRHNEIIAIRAAGLSLARISVPYLVIGALLSAALFLLNETVVPDASEKAERLKNKHQSVASGKKDWQYRVNFRNAREDRIWNIAAFNTKTYEMVEPHVEWRFPDGSRKQIIAKNAIRTNDMWVFNNVELFSYPPKVDFEKDVFPIRTNQFSMAELTEEPSNIKAQIRFSKLNPFDATKRPQFALKEISYLLSHLEMNPLDRAMLKTQYQMRLAQPWTCFVVSLIALPFGARSNSRRNVFVGVASSIAICFIYFVLLRFSSALGTGAFIPAWLAAWTPNVLFAAIGLWLTWKIN
jgi:lipopolysaccharide export system permease protein